MTLLTKIKESEGFSGFEYDDHLGNPTIGYGTLLPISEEEAEMLLKHRLANMINELLYHKPFVSSLSDNRKDVLFEMAYQMGVPNLLKFKNMWEGLLHQDFNKASLEMLDSIWARQTPNRAKRLAERMKNDVS